MTNNCILWFFVGCAIPLTGAAIINHSYRVTNLIERQTIAIEQINHKLNDIRVQITLKQEQTASCQYVETK